jgi:hypothetical protein
MIPGRAGLLAAKRLWGQRHRREQLGDQLEACQAAVDFETFHPQLNSSRVCQTFGFCWGAGNG